jgi:uncharacterized protein (TIGR02284 family)
MPRKDHTMSDQHIISTLNELIETSLDGEQGFNACAQHVASNELRSLFTQRALECKRAVSELSPLVLEYGAKPEQNGSASGALHRGWVAIRGSLVGYSDEALLEECERGEDHAVARYRKALAQTDLPLQLRSVIEQQFVGVKHNHDQVKRLRDQQKATL